MEHGFALVFKEGWDKVEFERVSEMMGESFALFPLFLGMGGAVNAPLGLRDTDSLLEISDMVQIKIIGALQPNRLFYVFLDIWPGYRAGFDLNFDDRLRPCSLKVLFRLFVSPCHSSNSGSAATVPIKSYSAVLPTRAQYTGINSVPERN